MQLQIDWFFLRVNNICYFVVKHQKEEQTWGDSLFSNYSILSKFADCIKYCCELNLKGIFSILRDTWPWCFKSKNSHNLHYHRQELTLVVGTLTQKAIIVLKNNNIWLKSKLCHCSSFHFEKKLPLSHF